MNEVHEILTRTRIFHHVSSQDILKILSHVHYQVKHFEQDEILALSNETCRNLMIVLNGSVRGEMVDYSGKAIKIEDICGPDTVASAFIFGKDNVFPVDITANEPTDVLYINKESLLGIFQDHKQVLLNFLNIVSSRSQFLTEKMKFLSFKSIQQKLAYYLLSLAKDNETMIELTKSQTELAVIFGVERPSLGRVIARLEEKGIIEIDKRQVKLKNVDALKKLAV